MTTQTGELVPVPAEGATGGGGGNGGALVSVGQQAGTLALAEMSDHEFETRLAALKKGRDRIARIQRELMEKDVDYGIIPGTPKPTLLKPGAEKLCDIYGFRANFQPTRIAGDGVTAPTLAYETRCELHLGSLFGPVVAVGYGTANSWERRHRYRTAERACPECGSVGTLLKSRKGEREWFCWARKGGCGATFPLDDRRIVEQHAGVVENPDPHDLDVTLVKMSEKRAFVDATLRACAASGLFTQDVEDQPEAATADAGDQGERQESEASVADKIALRRDEIVKGPPASSAAAQCAARSPRGEQCALDAGHGGDHRQGVKRWSESQQAAGAADGTAVSGDAEPPSEEAPATPSAGAALVDEAQRVLDAKPVPPDVQAGLDLLPPDQPKKGGQR